MLKDLLLSSRSYRSFDESVKISPEQLADWVDCVRYAPSSINLQMLKFVAVTDETLCARLLANTRWAGKITDMKLPPDGHAPVAYVVICADTHIVTSPERFD
jgi:nitroreductase